MIKVSVLSDDGAWIQRGQIHNAYVLLIVMNGMHACGWSACLVLECSLNHCRWNVRTITDTHSESVVTPIHFYLIAYLQNIDIIRVDILRLVNSGVTNSIMSTLSHLCVMNEWTLNKRFCGISTNRNIKLYLNHLHRHSPIVIWASSLATVNNNHLITNICIFVSRLFVCVCVYIFLMFFHT